jgi:hypothetical protein
MWSSKLSSGRHASSLQAGMALDSVRRDTERKKELQQESQGVARRRLDDEVYERNYSAAAQDKRCALRHSPPVVASLRAWARTLEAHPRFDQYGDPVPGRPVYVSEDMYVAAVLKISLALTAESSRRDLKFYAERDWKDDSRGKKAISFERFKDAVFQVPDLWTDVVDAGAYASFLDEVLRCCTGPDGAFLDDYDIVRASARPLGAEREDAVLVAARERRDQIEQARERREAALLLQRRQRERLLELERQRLAKEREAFAARAEARQRAEEERRRAEAELERILNLAAAAGARDRAMLAKAQRALELKVIAERSQTRMRMRSLGLLPALVSPRTDNKKLHIEEGCFEEARGWLGDADATEAWARPTRGCASLRSLSPTGEAQELRGASEECTRLRQELRSAGVFSYHARDILRRADTGYSRRAHHHDGRGGTAVPSPRALVPLRASTATSRTGTGAGTTGADRLWAVEDTTSGTADTAQEPMMPFPPGLGSRCSSPRADSPRRYLGAGFRSIGLGAARPSPRRAPAGVWSAYLSAAEGEERQRSPGRAVSFLIEQQRQQQLHARALRRTLRRQAFA